MTEAGVPGGGDEPTTLVEVADLDEAAGAAVGGDDPLEARAGTSSVPPVPREQPAYVADERTALTARLDFLRATVINKVAGLDDETARATLLQPSALSAAGVVQHLAGTERWWFSIDFAADPDVPWPWDPDAPDAGGFHVPDDLPVAEVVQAYVDECRRSDAVIAAADLDDHARGDAMYFDLRYALIHIIEETARHAGHLDLLREHADGTVGE